MERFTNLLFHTLKGIRGWSTLSLERIDVSKVLDIGYKRRLFSLFNRDHPFSLKIIYNEPVQYTEFAPVFSKYGGFTVYERTDLTQILTKRYKSEEECQLEICAVKAKQNILLRELEEEKRRVRVQS